MVLEAMVFRVGWLKLLRTWLEAENMPQGRYLVYIIYCKSHLKYEAEVGKCVCGIYVGPNVDMLRHRLGYLVCE